MKKQAKTKRFHMPSLRSVLLVYSVLASTASLVIFGLFLMTYMQQQKIFAEHDFKVLVRDAQIGLYSAPERTTATITFPEMRLSIPATNDTKDLLYDYQEADTERPNEFPSSATIASRYAINNLSKTIEQFPCGRLAEIVFDEKGADRSNEFTEFAFEKKLSDGRTMYVYQNKAACTNVWSQMNSDKAVELLKQAVSTQ